MHHFEIVNCALNDYPWQLQKPRVAYRRPPSESAEIQEQIRSSREPREADAQRCQSQGSQYS